MTQLELTFTAVSLPGGTSASVTVYEDVSDDGGASTATELGYAADYDNVDTVSLSDGQTAYTTADTFDGSSGNGILLVPEEHPDASDPSVSPSVTWSSATVDLAIQPPTNLAVTQGAEGELDLTWDDNNTNEDGHYVYRATSSGSSTSDYTQVADLGADVTSYTDTGRLDGERYYYRVSAYDGSTESDLSNEDSAVTVLPAPTGLSVSNVTASSADLQWTDNADNEDAYRVYLERADDPTGMDFTGLGTREYINVGETPHDGNPTFSAAVRFAVDGPIDVDSNNNWRNLLGSDGRTNFLLIEQGESLTFRAPASTTGVLGSATSASTDGSLNTAIVDYDGSTKHLYVNNDSGSSESVSNSSVNLGGFFIGANDEFHNLDGRIYEVSLYDRVLTSTERTEWENGNVPSGPIGYWPLDLNQSGTTPDLSEYANDGTVNGATLTGAGLTDVSGALAAGTTSYSPSGLLNGEQYHAYVHAETEHTTVRDV